MQRLNFTIQRSRHQYSPFMKPIEHRRLVNEWMQLHRDAVEFANIQLLRWPNGDFNSFYNFYMETNS